MGSHIMEQTVWITFCEVNILFSYNCGILILVWLVVTPVTSSHLYSDLSVFFQLIQIYSKFL